ncbi:MAG: hypothetical protein Q9209_002404 [Squamulea sp. 1 TL-2023]
MPIQPTARCPGQLNSSAKFGNRVGQAEQQDPDIVYYNNLDDDQTDDQTKAEMARCLANPKLAWRIYKTRQERIAKKDEEREKRIAQAMDDGDICTIIGEARDREVEKSREREFDTTLARAEIDVTPRNISASTVEVSDRKTRFGGTKRPFVGERLDGEPLTTTARSKKRKTDRPYPSPPSTPPEKRLQLTPPAPSRGKRSAAPELEERFWMASSKSQSRGETIIEENQTPIVWNKDFSWDQPKRTKSDFDDDLYDPDPIYEVKRINCRYKVPGTNMTEYWRNGTMTYGGPFWRPWMVHPKVDGYNIELMAEIYRRRFD